MNLLKLSLVHVSEAAKQTTFARLRDTSARSQPVLGGVEHNPQWTPVAEQIHLHTTSKVQNIFFSLHLVLYYNTYDVCVHASLESSLFVDIYLKFSLGIILFAHTIPRSISFLLSPVSLILTGTQLNLDLVLFLLATPNTEETTRRCSKGQYFFLW